MSLPSLTIFGNLDPDSIKRIEKVFSHSSNLFCAVLDEKSLRDQEALDLLIQKFPSNILKEFDLFLLLAECMANAVCYANIKIFGIQVRRRKKLLLISVYHEPEIAESVDYVLRNAHDGWLPDYESDPPNGLGFPILFRLAYQITISQDRSRLQLWVRLREQAAAG